MTKIDGSGARTAARPTEDITPATTSATEDVDVQSLDEMCALEPTPESSAVEPESSTVEIAATGATVAGGALAAWELTRGASTLTSVGGHAINVAGGGLVAMAKLESTEATNELTRAVDAATSGALFAALGVNPAIGAFLAIDAVAEMTIEAGARQLLGDDATVKVGVGTHLNSSVTALTVYVFRDEEGAKAFMEAAAKGEHGPFMKAAVWLGDNFFDTKVAYDFYSSYFRD